MTIYDSLFRPVCVSICDNVRTAFSRRSALIAVHSPYHLFWSFIFSFEKSFWCILEGCFFYKFYSLSPTQAQIRESGHEERDFEWFALSNDFQSDSKERNFKWGFRLSILNRNVLSMGSTHWVPILMVRQLLLRQTGASFGRQYLVTRT